MENAHKNYGYYSTLSKSREIIKGVQATTSSSSSFGFRRERLWSAFGSRLDGGGGLPDNRMARVGAVAAAVNFVISPIFGVAGEVRAFKNGYAGEVEEYDLEKKMSSAW